MDKPDALRLADRLESDFIRSQTMLDAAAELRRLHAENERLAALVCDYAAEEAPDALRTLAADRDRWHTKAQQAEVQRDALLEALATAKQALNHEAPSTPQPQLVHQRSTGGHAAVPPGAREGERRHQGGGGNQMTRDDDIIRMAREAGLCDSNGEDDDSVNIARQLQRFAALVAARAAAAERDRMCELFGLSKELARESAKGNEAD